MKTTNETVRAAALDLSNGVPADEALRGLNRKQAAAASRIAEMMTFARKMAA